ncbi:MAG: hypothetical protein AAF799_41435 [Myxococcota bacterium]
MRNKMVLVSTPLSLLLVLCFGCDESVIPNGAIEAATEILEGDCETTEPDGDRELNPGDNTTPKATFKGICDDDVDVDWDVCLVEENDDGEEIQSLDGNGREICGSLRTELVCENNEFELGDTFCLGGYCSWVIGDDPSPYDCGWVIVGLSAKIARTGESLGFYNAAFVESLGFELLPVSRE